MQQREESKGGRHFIQSAKVSGDRGQEAGPPERSQSHHLNQDTREAPPPRPCGHTQPLPHPGDASGSSTPHNAWRCARVSACINSPSPSFLSRTELASTFGVCLSVTDFYAPTSLPLHLSRSVLWPRIHTVSPGMSPDTCEQRALHTCWVEGSMNVH